MPDNSSINSNNEMFVTMKSGTPEIVHSILNGEKNITIDGVYTLSEKLTLKRIVFVTLGGDTGKKEVDWEPGFQAIATISREPYDHGYSPENKSNGICRIGFSYPAVCSSFSSLPIRFPSRETSNFVTAAISMQHSGSRQRSSQTGISILAAMHKTDPTRAKQSSRT